MLVPDYYERLEISPNATLKQIKISYRRLVRLHHPDINKQGKDTRIKQLNEAYGVLSSLTRRAAYDELRLEEQRAAAIADAIRRRQEAAQRKKVEEPKMTWKQGAIGFVRELRKALHEN
jgi:curved DNA-binding protein CbpA